MQAEIAQALLHFEPADLSELSPLLLMDRFENKYILSSGRVQNLLNDLQPCFRVLEINNQRIHRYESRYYDTPSFGLFADHERGRVNRCKIRTRTYLESGTHFLETKFKNNKGQTTKKRMKLESIDLTGNAGADLFILQTSGYSTFTLEPKLWSRYSRMTLLNNLTRERITIDLGISFAQEEKDTALPGLAIVEIKQMDRGPGSCVPLLRRHKAKQTSVSKYCLGVSYLYDSVINNNFKPALLQINKIQNEV
jgi:hypothetical protein